MKISDYISKDIPQLSTSDSILDAKRIFDTSIFSHIPILENDILIGLLPESDVRTIEEENKTIGESEHYMDHFHCYSKDNWMDIIKLFSRNESNILPILDKNNKCIGHYELSDIIHLFSDAIFINENGYFIEIEKDSTDYSISEIAQIVESNDDKVLGIFLASALGNNTRINIKIASKDINETIQTFRRYNYTVVTQIKEDKFLESLQERSDYFKKYLNM